MKYFFIFLVTSFFAHNYHVSNTLVHHNGAANTLEITVKIFYDDMKRLREMKEESATTMDFVFDTDKYIQENLILKINNLSMTLDPIGREVEDEMVYCYFEVHNLPDVVVFDVTDSLLFDLYPDQTNMVDVEMNGWTKRVLLTSKQSTERVVG